jgi:hypothetical protein
MNRRLAEDPVLADEYRLAHQDYLLRREELGSVEEINGISAGGMPDRVKCLHVLAAHSLAAGAGENPLGDEVLAALDDWWAKGPCGSAQDVNGSPQDVNGSAQGESA